ncbi:DNA-binding response OmpR family regulator [Friedmanniella endophytica]|uniref:DNA-binding response OmpR family regulator n=1 Tax=Microlunatus kandeliicorticis TaxID=1759536 RepID=A0A7W3IR69_9ACTN|nr:response regulator transcription factor [Microlunatus kandeliicorticis]MBA8793734.1 DNA-binding response OmpR family regulator [Microlunatus kandeliicorticis]
MEDDPVIGEATQLNLERYDYEVEWATDGLRAWQIFEQHRGDDAAFDVVLSDIMLPGLDGISLCRRVRGVGDTPFLLVSARGDSIDVVTGLEAGADDYVTKPFDVQVLLARLRSVARRSLPTGRAESGAATELETYGDLTLDRQALELRRDGEPVPLTPTEMRLFLELADNTGVVLSRNTLLTRVWDYPDWADDAHLVNVHIQRLRAKIGNDRIETVRGFGYKLRR